MVFEVLFPNPGARSGATGREGVLLFSFDPVVGGRCSGGGASLFVVGGSVMGARIIYVFIYL